MNLTVEFRLYTRLYKSILENRLGLWTSRTGLIVRLQDQETGHHGYGEIAPFPGFRSETYDQAFAFVNRLCYPIGKPHPPLITEETIAQIPEHLTATRFGLGGALAQVSAPQSNAQTEIPENPLAGSQNPPQAALLPRGSLALEAWHPYWEQGYRTFKWKIGLSDPAVEMKLLDKLLTVLPPETQLRLDANGNLNLAQAQDWLKACDPQRIEFLEQPLDPEQKDDLLQLAQDSPIPLALDESVSTLTDLQEWASRWPGILVLKVPLLGFAAETRSFLRSHCLTYTQSYTETDRETYAGTGAGTHPLDLVFSSVLETSIARKTALDIAQQFQNPKRAMGFGVQTWFDLEDGFEDSNPDTIWERLS